MNSHLIKSISDEKDQIYILEKAKFASTKLIDEYKNRRGLNLNTIKIQLKKVLKSDDIDSRDNLTYYELKYIIRTKSTLDLRKIRNFELNHKRRRFLISLIINSLSALFINTFSNMFKMFVLQKTSDVRIICAVNLGEDNI